MANEHYQRVKDIFQAACEMHEADRPAYLQHACEHDPELLKDVQALLNVDVRGTGFLESPAINGEQFLHGVSAAVNSSESQHILPASIGRYRIIRLIGEGGMGTVYEAEQDIPNRRVALKVVRSGLLSPKLAERFKNEVEILGRLHHNGIAQIFDAGVAELRRLDGSSTEVQYFAMEYVAGVPLTDHAQSERLRDDERLKLLADVCDAVHYGHLQGVIHRDLKPANILVDSSGEAKVIDFGVARATDSDVAITTLQTDAGQILGTLAYMSPEQVSGSRQTVDARSDVYSLGVIGYELLSNRLPFDLAGMLVPQAARVIQDAEPSRLSSISRVYRGDIETIVGKAIEKEPSRRYQSAAEMAADIRRFLANEPIVARPPTVRYQLSKFARRHKELVAGLMLVFLALLGGIAGISVALGRALSGEQEAAVQTANVQAVNQFLIDMIGAANPKTAGKPDVSVREALDQAAARLDAGDFADQPLVAAAVRYALGQSYYSISRYQEAIAMFERSLAARLEVLGPDHADTLSAQIELSDVHLEIMDYPRAIALKEEVVASIRRVHSDQNDELAKGLTSLGRAYTLNLQFDEANAALEQALAMRTESLDPMDKRLAATLHSWALSATQQGDYAKARECYGRAIAILKSQPDLAADDLAALQTDQVNLLIVLGYLDEAVQSGEAARATYLSVYGPEHNHTMMAEGWLALALQEMGRFDEAEALFTHVLEVATQVHGKETLTYMGTQLRLGNLACLRGNYDQAEHVLEAAQALAVRIGGPDHLAVVAAQSGLAQVMYRTGRFEEAHLLAARVLEVRRQKLGPSAPALAPPLTLMGAVLTAQDQYAEAEALLREALAIRELRTPDHWQIHLLHSLLGDSLAGQDRLAEAEPLLVEGATALASAPYVPERDRREARERVAAFYERTSWPDEAGRWR